MLLVQKILGEYHSSLEEDSFADVGVYLKRSKEYSNLIMLKYDQIEANWEIPWIHECRGIILDEADNFRVVCYTYPKFFNVGEKWAAPVDTTQAKVMEKLDGILIQLYYYRGQWRIATSGTPDAMTPVGNHPFSFRDLFFQHVTQEQLKQLDTNCCYALELMSPYNRIVIPYQEVSVALHGVRDLTSLQEKDPAEYSHVFKLPKFFDSASVEELKNIANTSSGIELEGFVVYDGKHRVKIKGDPYVYLHHCISSTSDKNLMNLVRSGESSEFLTYFPHLKDNFNKYSQQIDDLEKSTVALWSELKPALSSSRKDFALALQSKRPKCAGYLFKCADAVSKGHHEPHFKHWLNEISENSYFSLFVT